MGRVYYTIITTLVQHDFSLNHALVPSTDYNPLQSKGKNRETEEWKIDNRSKAFRIKEFENQAV